MQREKTYPGPIQIHSTASNKTTCRRSVDNKLYKKPVQKDLLDPVDTTRLGLTSNEIKVIHVQESTSAPSARASAAAPPSTPPKAYPVLGPLRPALPRAEKKSYRLKSAVADENGDLRQTYVFKSGFWSEAPDEVLELVWKSDMGT